VRHSLLVVDRFAVFRALSVYKIVADASLEERKEIIDKHGLS